MYSQFSDNAKWVLKPRRNWTLANPAAASYKDAGIEGVPNFGVLQADNACNPPQKV